MNILACNVLLGACWLLWAVSAFFIIPYCFSLPSKPRRKSFTILLIVLACSMVCLGIILPSM